MTITSAGYDGTVDEVQWAKMAAAFGAGQYGVVGAGDWKVSAHPTTDKAVLVAPGSGWGAGVLDVSDAPATVQCAALGSGTRWDLITVKRDWQPATGITTFSKVTGGAVKVIPARLTSPGDQDEQPLALVQWTFGQTQPSAIIDLRCWAGNGGMFAKEDLVRSYLNRPGASVNIAGVRWSYQLDGSDMPGWQPGATGGSVQISIATNDTSKSVFVPFPVTYPTPPNVVASLASNVAGPASRLVVSGYSATTTGFTAKVQTNDNVKLGAGYDITVKWHALPVAGL